MTQSIKAILARFGGDHAKAAKYCVEMASTYPALRQEYSTYAEVINESKGMAVGA